MMNQNQMLNPVCREQLARRLACNGKFTVRFVTYPDRPEVFEFVARPKGEKPIRYINMYAERGANLSIFI
nr:MAG TPA: hypothetical protein [Caudoviricetes sp.]